MIIDAVLIIAMIAAPLVCFLEWQTQREKRRMEEITLLLDLSINRSRTVYINNKPCALTLRPMKPEIDWDRELAELKGDRK